MLWQAGDFVRSCPCLRGTHWGWLGVRWHRECRRDRRESQLCACFLSQATMGACEVGPEASRDRVDVGPNTTALSYLTRGICGHISGCSGLGRRAPRMQLGRGVFGLI